MTSTAQRRTDRQPLNADQVSTLSGLLSRVNDGDDVESVQRAADLAGLGGRFLAALDRTGTTIGPSGQSGRDLEGADTERSRPHSQTNDLIRDRTRRASARRAVLSTEKEPAS